MHRSSLAGIQLVDINQTNSMCSSSDGFLRPWPAASSSSDTVAAAMSCVFIDTTLVPLSMKTPSRKVEEILVRPQEYVFSSRSVSDHRKRARRRFSTLLVLAALSSVAHAWLRIEPECGPNLPGGKVKVRRRAEGDGATDCFLLHPLIYPGGSEDVVTSRVTTSGGGPPSAGSADAVAKSEAVKKNPSQPVYVLGKPSGEGGLSPGFFKNFRTEGGSTTSDSVVEYVVDIPNASDVWAWSILDGGTHCKEQGSEVEEGPILLERGNFAAMRPW